MSIRQIKPEAELIEYTKNFNYGEEDIKALRDLILGGTQFYMEDYILPRVEGKGILIDKLPK